MSESSEDVNNNSNKKEEFDVSKLPTTIGFSSNTLSLYQGTWYFSVIVSNIIAFQQRFQAQPQDTILASSPKSGTTWLKALLFSILNRDRYTNSNTPLLTTNPHKLVPFVEMGLYCDTSPSDPPRLIATHIRYSSLPKPVLESPDCRIVYVCRNPLDVIVSFWNFRPKSDDNPQLTIEECVEKFCAGEHEAGPFWDHVLGFWKASLENPEKVLFLKYDDMLEDAISHVERIADFVGFPFSDEEKKHGVHEGIVNLCSFANLKELDVNKHGKSNVSQLENKAFFRKGQVGDWVNHLSPPMVERVKKAINEKLSGSGLNFKYIT